MNNPEQSIIPYYSPISAKGGTRTKRNRRSRHKKTRYNRRTRRRYN